jgi:ribosomal protein L37E
METIMQCRSCGEDANRADWEAARDCCPHCGEPSKRVVRSGLESLSFIRQRLELELVWRPAVGHA